MHTLYIEVEPGHVVNLLAAIEIEQDPDNVDVVMLTFPAPGYLPEAPLLVPLTGELAMLVLAWAQQRADEGLETLRGLIAEYDEVVR